MKRNTWSVAELQRRSVLDPVTGCWVWSMGRRGSGPFERQYGCTRGGPGGERAAHRIAYTLSAGAIPSDLWVLHRCDNPPCVNPDHLFLGEPSDNSADMVRKGRSRAAEGTDHYTQRTPGKRTRGERHGQSKLTDDAVREIRALRQGGAMQRAVATRFGVSQSVISLVMRGRAWTHVT